MWLFLYLMGYIGVLVCFVFAILGAFNPKYWTAIWVLLPISIICLAAGRFGGAYHDGIDYGDDD